jgi:hypothetical protein
VTSHDAINAAFEGGGAIFLCLNVRRLLKDKSVKGVSLLATSWWTAWGFWNVYFYSAVNTPASFWAGIAVVLVNAVWLCLAVYYARAERRAAVKRLAVAHAWDAPSADGGEWFQCLGVWRREVMTAQCPACDGVLYHGKGCTHGL